MTAARDRFLKNVPFLCHATSSLSFSNVEILAVLTTSFCEVIVTAPQSNEHGLSALIPLTTKEFDILYPP